MPNSNNIVNGEYIVSKQYADTKNNEQNKRIESLEAATTVNPDPNNTIKVDADGIFSTVKFGLSSNGTDKLDQKLYLAKEDGSEINSDTSIVIGDIHSNKVTSIGAVVGFPYGQYGLKYSYHEYNPDTESFEDKKDVEIKLPYIATEDTSPITIGYKDFQSVINGDYKAILDLHLDTDNTELKVVEINGTKALSIGIATGNKPGIVKSDDRGVQPNNRYPITVTPDGYIVISDSLTSDVLRALTEDNIIQDLNDPDNIDSKHVPSARLFKEAIDNIKFTYIGDKNAINGLNNTSIVSAINDMKSQFDAAEAITVKYPNIDNTDGSKYNVVSYNTFRDTMLEARALIDTKVSKSDRVDQWPADLNQLSEDHFPSAKLVATGNAIIMDLISELDTNKQDIANLVTVETDDDTKYPSAKLLKSTKDELKTNISDLDARILIIDGSINTINTSITDIYENIKLLKDRTLNAVYYTDISDVNNPNRKAIVLENHYALMGKKTDTTTIANLIMLSKWDKADVGSGSIEINLNGSADNPTYNDTKKILLDTNIVGATGGSLEITSKKYVDEINTALEADIAGLDGRLTAAENTIVTNTNDITALTTRVGDNETSITNLEAKDVELSSDIIDLDGRVTANESDITTLTGRVDGHDTDIEALQNKDTDLDNDISGLDGRLTTAESSIDQNTKNISEITNRLRDAETDINNLETKDLEIDNSISDLDTRVTNNRTDIDEIKVEATNLETRVTNTELSIKSLTESNAELVSGVSDLGTRVDGHDTTITNITDTELPRIDSEISAVETSINEINTNKVNDFNTVNGTNYPTTEAVSNFVNAKVTDLNNDINDLDTRLTTVDGNVTAVTNTANQNTQNIAALTTRVGDNETSINNLEAKDVELSGRIDSNDTDITALQNKDTELEAKLTIVEGSIADINDNKVDNFDDPNTDTYPTTNAVNTFITDKVTTLESTINANKTDADNKINALTQSVTTAESDIDTLTDEVTEHDTKIQAVERSITTITSDIQGINTKVSANEGSITTLTTNVGNNTSDIAALTTRIETNENNITDISGKVTILEGSVDDITTTEIPRIEGLITANTNNINSLDTRVTDNESDIADINNSISNINLSVSNLDGKVTANETSINSNTTEISTIKGNITTIKSDISAINGNKAIDFNTIDDNKYPTTKAVDTYITDKVNAVSNRVNTLEGTVNTNTTDIAALEGRVDAIEGNKVNNLNSPDADTYPTTNAVNTFVTTKVAEVSNEISTLEGTVNSNTSNITDLQTRTTKLEEIVLPNVLNLSYSSSTNKFTWSYPDGYTSALITIYIQSVAGGNDYKMMITTNTEYTVNSTDTATILVQTYDDSSGRFALGVAKKNF